MENIMIVQFAKWGDSLALRIPADVARQLAAAEGKQAEMKIEAGSLVITPVDPQVAAPVEPLPVYDLDELLSKITPENIHEEISTGRPVGNELL
jgi:antitoxin MazE